MFMTIPTLIFPLMAGRFVARSVPGSVVLTWSIGPDDRRGGGNGHDSMAGPFWMVPSMLLLGSGFGLSAGLLDGEALARVSTQDAGMAAGWVNTIRLGSEAISVSLFGAVFSATAPDGYDTATAQFSLVTLASTLIALLLGTYSIASMRYERKETRETYQHP